jgi:hypothetical protein
MVASIPLFIIGNHEIDEARRRSAWLSLTPTLAGGMAAGLNVSF